MRVAPKTVVRARAIYAQDLTVARDNLGAELYITNNINYLYNYKEVKPITINIGDNSLTILR